MRTGLGSPPPTGTCYANPRWGLAMTNSRHMTFAGHDIQKFAHFPKGEIIAFYVMSQLAAI